MESNVCPIGKGKKNKSTFNPKMGEGTGEWVSTDQRTAGTSNGEALSQGMNVGTEVHFTQFKPKWGKKKRLGYQNSCEGRKRGREMERPWRLGGKWKKGSQKGKERIIGKVEQKTSTDKQKPKPTQLTGREKGLVLKEGTGGSSSSTKTNQ